MPVLKLKIHEIPAISYNVTVRIESKPSLCVNRFSFFSSNVCQGTFIVARRFLSWCPAEIYNNKAEDVLRSSWICIRVGSYVTCRRYTRNSREFLGKLRNRKILYRCLYTRCKKVVFQQVISGPLRAYFAAKTVRKYLHSKGGHGRRWLKSLAISLDVSLTF